MSLSNNAKKRKRRERDRPKASPDASYNPNKRIVLSYSSDDGEVDVPIPQPNAAVNDAELAEPVDPNYEIAPYPDVEDVEEPDEPTLDEDGQSMDQGAGPDEDEELQQLEMVDQQSKKDGSLRTRGVIRDMDTGQWPALGSELYQGDEENMNGLDEQDSETEEAIAYLRGVRSERQNMPAFFAAPAKSEYEELYESGVGDSRGYLSEGTYVARPVIGAVMPDSAKMFITPQEAYTRNLKQRFLTHRQHMHNESDPVTNNTLGPQHPTAFDGSKRARALWRNLLKETVPLPAQLREMDQTTVYKLLETIQQCCIVRNADISDVTGVWIWSLLGRLDDVGTMNNDEVFTVREFAKKAVLVQLSFDNPAAAEQLESMNEATRSPPDPITDAIEEKVQEAEDVVLNDLRARENTLIMLDLIITIVGDVFGQRDLLEFRRDWTKQEGHSYKAMC